MADRLEDFEDVSVYTIEPERRDALLARGRECSVVWSTRDGWPIGVVHHYIWRDGRFWVTCTERRKRVAALRREPKSSVIVALDDEQGITAKTRATVHPGAKQASWFYPALAESVLVAMPPNVRAEGIDGFVKRLESDTRVVIEFDPIKWITFDGRRVKAHTEGAWAPGEPWIEPDGTA